MAKKIKTPVLISYRIQGRYGWINVRAKDDEDAIRQAYRSTDIPTDLEVWDGSKYVPVAAKDERTEYFRKTLLEAIEARGSEGIDDFVALRVLEDFGMSSSESDALVIQELRKGTIKGLGGRLYPARLANPAPPAPRIGPIVKEYSGPLASTRIRQTSGGFVTEERSDKAVPYNPAWVQRGRFHDVGEAYEDAEYGAGVTESRPEYVSRMANPTKRPPKVESSFTSPGGREFTVGKGVHHGERFPGDTFWSDHYQISYNDKPAGKLYRSLHYGKTAEGSPRWHATVRELYWENSSSLPANFRGGFDVAAFDTSEAALKAWGRSADEILDAAEGSHRLPNPALAISQTAPAIAPEDIGPISIEKTKGNRGTEITINVHSDVESHNAAIKRRIGNPL